MIGVNFLYDSQPKEGGDYLSVFPEEKKTAEIGKPLNQIEEEKHQEDEDIPAEEFEYDENKQLLGKKQQ
jgi:hypothetical protein